MCDPFLGMGIGAEDLSVLLELPEALVASALELRLKATSTSLSNASQRIELSAPDGRTIVIHDHELVGPDFDLTFSDSGVRYHDAHLTSGLAVQPRYPLSFALFADQELEAGIWTAYCDITGETSQLDELCLRIFANPCDLTAPTDVVATVSGGSVVLSWENGDTYDAVELFMGGQVAARLEGDVKSFETDVLQPGPYRFDIEGVRGEDQCRARGESVFVDVGLETYCAEPGSTIRAGAILEHEIEVDAGRLVDEVEVKLEIAAPGTGPLTITLVSPEGTEITLHEQREASGGLNVIFSDRGRANTPVLLPDFECECRVRPQGPGSFSDLSGHDATGAWRITVSNDAVSSVATLSRWCVRVYGLCESSGPMALACDPSATGVELGWMVDVPHDAIYVYRDEIPIAVLPEMSESILDSGVEAGHHTYHLATEDDGCLAVSGGCGVDYRMVSICSTDALDGDPVWFTGSRVTTGLRVRLDEIEVSVELSAGSLDTPYLELESPWGTTVILASGVRVPAAGDDSLLVHFADRGAPFEGRHLVNGGIVAPAGPGRLSDLAGEMSQGPQPWTLRFFRLERIDRWCVRMFVNEAEELGAIFRRGDADGSDTVSPLLDALFLLTYGFLDGPVPPCLDAADIDDSGALSPLLDALYLLQWAFVEGPAPPAPGGGCGPDETSDDLDCAKPAACE